MLSNFAFNFNLRRYNLVVLFTSSATVIQFAVLGQLLVGHSAWFGALCLVASVVGRCRLTLSKPVLKAPMVSALEITMC